MRISDWSSDVCSSDLATHRGIPPASDAHPHSAACRWLPWRAIWPANLSGVRSTCPLYEGATLYFSLNCQRTLFGQAAKRPVFPVLELGLKINHSLRKQQEIGRAWCRTRVCKYV